MTSSLVAVLGVALIAGLGVWFVVARLGKPGSGIGGQTQPPASKVQPNGPLVSGPGTAKGTGAGTVKPPFDKDNPL